MNAERSRFQPLHFAGCIALSFGFLALANSAQTQTQTAHHPAHPPVISGTPPAPATPQMKGVWEPMNYPDDILLESVFFANDQNGWIAAKGSGGAIMHTSDGGANWQFQMGDPHGSDPAIYNLQFVDATHGWAYQSGGQLLRTTDGKTWEAVGLVPNSSIQQYRFVSAQVGFAISGNYTGSAIYTTNDGGRTWMSVFTCTTTIQVNGLTHNVGCYLGDIYFPSAKVGYAVGGGYNDAWSAFVKTDDGGQTWRVIFASTEVDQADNVFFTDEKNGVIRVRGDRTVITDDGGQTWRGATGNTKGVFKFGDPEVGWSCTIGYAPSCSISTDGGKSWITHDFNLPGDFSDFSVPRRDLLYAVGDHGMIYRYRVVPSTYKAQGAVDYPAVPSYGGPILDQLQQMQNQVAALQTQLGGTPTAPPPSADASGGFSQSTPAQSGAGDSLGNQVAPPSGGFSQGASGASNAPPAAASAGASASGGGFSQDAPGGSGVAPAGQDASASGGFSQNASASGGDATQDPTAAATGFSQDASAAPSSQFVQTTCASAVQSLQTIFTSVVTMIPQFGTQFRNLNNVFAGLNMLTSMMTSAKQVKDDFVAVKKAANAQAALAALADLSKTLQSISQSITTQFSSLTSAPASGGAGGVIGNQMGGAPAAGSSAAPAASSPPASAGTTAGQSAGSTASSTASSTATTATTHAVNKIKSKIPPF